MAEQLSAEQQRWRVPLQRVVNVGLAQVQRLIAGIGPRAGGLHIGHGGTHDGRWWAGQSALVVQQVVAPAETSTATVTAEGLLPIVDQHMRLQLVRVGEAGVAEFARVGSLTGVHSQMAPQVSDLHELPITVAAVVRFLACVQPHVCLEVVVAGETLVAFGTLKGLLAGVRSLVVLQDVLVAKGAAADLARKHLVLVASDGRGMGGGGVLQGARRLWRRSGCGRGDGSVVQKVVHVRVNGGHELLLHQTAARAALLPLQRLFLLRLLVVQLGHGRRVEIGCRGHDVIAVVLAALVAQRRRQGL